MVQKTLKLLKLLKADNRITIQQYRTYRGQVLHGDVEGCITGLKRKKLIPDRKE